MAPKRKHSNFDVDDGTGFSRKRCSYCFKERESMVSGRSYCSICAADSSHCNICCRPLPHRLVENGICHTCRRKRKNKNIQTGLGGRALVEDTIPLANDNIDPLNSLINAKGDVRERLLSMLKEYHGVKWYIVLVMTMMKHNREGEEIIMETAFQSETGTLLIDFDIDEQFNKQVDVIMHRLKEFVRNGSGWIIQQIDKIVLHMASYKPILASSYISTPKKLAGKHAVINIQNGDNLCFMWSILAALHPQNRNAQRICKYKQYQRELNMTGLTFPLSIDQVKKFEHLNPSISVNVFAYDNKAGVYPVYITNYKARKHVNLLVLTQGDKNHYTWIKNMSSLLSQPGYGHIKYYCNYCLHGFRKQSTLEKHVDDCSKFGMQKVMLPADDERWVYFKSIQKMLRVPFVIYADFESYTSKLESQHHTNTSTYAYELHVPSGFAYHIVCSDSARIFEPVVYRGPNVVEEFLQRMRLESDSICQILSNVMPIQMKKKTKWIFKYQKSATCVMSLWGQIE